MFRPRIGRLLALLLTISATLVGAETPSFAPDELLVRFRPSAASGFQSFGGSQSGGVSASASAALQSVGAIGASSLGRTVGGSQFAAADLDGFEPLARTYRVTLPPGTDVLAAVAALNANPAVEVAEPNLRLSFSAVPSDPSYGLQWALRNTGQVGGRDGYDPATGISGVDIDAEIAWNVTTGSSSVVVAVIDSGVDYNHPDLSPNMWTNTGEIASNGIDDDANGYIDDVRGWDFASTVFPGDNNPMDDCGSTALGQGHGTHVAGIVGAVGNNATGVSGTAWNVRIMPLKVASSGCGLFTSDVVRAIQYATMEGARVINMSLGGNHSPAFETASNAARTAGVTLVAAAGNHGDATPIYPAAYSSVIGVAATDRRDAKASFSAFGSWVSLAAPGVALRSTFPTADGSYSYLSGTSMACPVVAGVSALVLSQYPALTPAQVEARLLNATENIGVSGIGAGRINAARALMDLSNVSPGTITASLSTTLTITGTGFHSGMSVRLTKSGAPDVTATGLNIVSHQQATCQVNVPAGYNGLWNVEVVIGQSVFSLPSSVVVEGVEITSVSPAVWPNTGVAGPIVINGKNFGSNLQAVLRRSGHSDIPTTSLTVNGSTWATASFNVTGATGGRWDVVVSSAGAESILSRGLAVTSPVYLVVSPPLGAASQFTVAVPQGDIVLDWPAGASASPVQIDIDAAPTLPTLDPNRDPYAATGIGVGLEIVGGPSTFSESFRLTLPYREIDLLDSQKEQALTLAYFNETTRRWQPVGGVAVDDGTRKVSGAAAHFSYFQLIQHVPAPNLDKVVAYPSPFRADRGHDRIVFDFLEANSTIKVFDLSGRLIRELSDDDGDGRIDWIGVTNESGEPIASGLYYYVAGADGQTKAGRLAVIR